LRDCEHQWAEWMREANAGGNDAYRRLLEALAPFVRAVVRRACQRSGMALNDVEDVVQETLLAIHLKRQTWDTAEPLTPWVRAIARNKFIDSLRRRGRRIDLPIDDFIDVLPAEQPEETLSPREAERLLSVLDGRQRQIVQAISVDGASIRETAARFGMTEGAARVALHRGLAALAAAYRSQEP
jgi:RNA polymerase sigma-70 factor (ECF subfamily)